MLNKAEYICDKCGRIFGNVTSLQTHNKEIHERLVCKRNDCMYEAFGTRDLTNHQATIH